jgi:hypothetical protein
MLDRHVGVGHRPRIGFTWVNCHDVESWAPPVCSSTRLQVTGTAISSRPSDPAAQRRIIKANRPGDSAGRMKTTHPALIEGGVMAHAASAPSGPPHRGSRKFTATALCWLPAGREHQGPAALTGQKADSKRGCAYRHRDYPPPSSRKFTCCRWSPVRACFCFGPDPSHSEHGAVIRRRSTTRYPIRQRECCRIIEENHSE